MSTSRFARDLGEVGVDDVAGTRLGLASETGCDEPLSTREAVPIETPARRLMSAGEARRAR